MKVIKLKENYLRIREPNPVYQLKVFDPSVASYKKIKYLDFYLMSLGIKQEDLISFLDKPRESDEDNPFDLDNMEEAIQVGYKMFTDPSTHLFVQVDADTDGYTSSSILINYLKRRFPQLKITYRLHTGKEHGVIVNTVPEDANLVIIPDAGSNQMEEHKQLVEAGKTVIILDHHEVDHFIERPNLILVNNQCSPRFSNKFMSGAGVVYMFIQAMDKTFFAEQPSIYKDYRDLAAIGIIADAMNMTTLGNNFLSYYGLNNIKSQFIHEIALRQARGIKDPEHLTKIDVAFYIAPVINGVIRSGEPKDKETVFRAMTEENSIEDVVTEWRGKIRHESLYEYAARIAANAKARQDSGKKKSFEWLKEKIEAEGLNKDNLIIVAMNEKESEKVNANVTGLIAMELVKYYNRPCLVLRKTTFEGEEVYGGSGRNGNFYTLPDLKEMLHQAGGFYQEGHANAFGVFLKPDQIQDIRNYFNEHVNADSFDDAVFEVDYYFENEVINSEMLMECAEYDSLYGNSIPQPKFAFQFDFDPKTAVQIMGKDESSIKINSSEVDFVVFKSPELAKQLKETKAQLLHAQIVGRAQINEWRGKKSIQVMVDDIEITENTYANEVKAEGGASDFGLWGLI